ncbi:MAG: CYTH domain-containing protein [Alphaproteobacteria bacterium]|nr:CYTH domain-containing protein [Alphaproteobacteria bacterium]
MPVEIERKFLVSGADWPRTEGQRYCQGYLTRGESKTVRIRRAGSRAILTIKGPPRGITRAEYEYPIPVDHAEEMLATLCGPLVEKMRFQVRHAGRTWSIDEFGGRNAGLRLAEIELERPDATFDRPPWLGEEVTHDDRYRNSSLARHPFSAWTSPP